MTWLTNHHTNKVHFQRHMKRSFWISTHIYENSQAKLRKGSSYIRKNIKTHPERRLGTLTFIRFRICRAIVSTMANLPSLPCGAPVSIDLRLSLSARQAVSKELSGPTDPDCAEAIATDCPIKAIQEISDAFGGPWFDMRAWTAERIFGSPAAWSILLITPIVRVPATNAHG